MSTRLKHIDWDHINKRKFYTIGPALFLGVRAITYPPALIKTRLQAQEFRTTPLNGSNVVPPRAVPSASASSAASLPATSLKRKMQTTSTADTNTATGQHIRRGQYKNTMDAFRTIVRTDGPLALWQGFLPKTIGIVGGNVYISCYEVLRSQMLKRSNSTILSDAIAGGIASLISQIIVVPNDLLSQRMAVDLDGRSMSWHFRTVWKEAGFYGLYRGYVPSIMTYAPVSSIWWSTYGFTKPYAAQPVETLVRGCTPSGSEPSAWTMERCTESTCGAVAGAIAGLLTNPMDVIKVRRQLSGPSVKTRHIISDLYQSEGALGFSRGAMARVLNMSPSGALVVTVYELIKRLSTVEDGHQ
jgi:hypothetical protein